ncbi:hypothetical protein AHAS_Ahas13G0221300 [Arachis hypogaea]
MAKKASCQGEATSRDTLRWTDEMDTTFIDALIEECRKENRVDGTFTTMAYDNILSLLRSIYGNHLRKENLKNRLKTLKDHFGVCYDHFHGLSEFCWNLITKMFEAEAEVWKELIKVAKEQVQIAKQQVRIVERGLVILEQNINVSLNESNQSSFHNLSPLESPFSVHVVHDFLHKELPVYSDCIADHIQDSVTDNHIPCEVVIGPANVSDPFKQVLSLEEVPSSSICPNPLNVKTRIFLAAYPPRFTAAPCANFHLPEQSTAQHCVLGSASSFSYD